MHVVSNLCSSRYFFFSLVKLVSGKIDDAVMNRALANRPCNVVFLSEAIARNLALRRNILTILGLDRPANFLLPQSSRVTLESAVMKVVTL